MSGSKLESETSLPQEKLKRWQEISLQKNLVRENLIPTQWRIDPALGSEVLRVIDLPGRCGILTDEELKVTEEYDATALVQALAERRLKCVDVTRAFCKRAAIAQQLTNCLTDVYFEEALAKAEKLEEYLEQNGKPMGPLHGLPISVKETYRIKGSDSTFGISALANKPSNSTSMLVDLLLAAGAVIICKTNVPQTLISTECHNNIFGRTMNPYNRNLTAGGSSGGEAVLVAMRGSALGVGSDLAGSLRVPAMCNGLYAVAPTPSRLRPNAASAQFPAKKAASPARASTAAGPAGQLKNVPTIQGRTLVDMQSSAGPIARSARDCELFFKTITGSRPWEYDIGIVPGLWESMDFSRRTREPDHKRGLVIGILSCDNVVTPLPPILRLLSTVSSALSAAGHTPIMVPTPPSFPELMEISHKLAGVFDGGPWLPLIEATQEPVTPSLASRLVSHPPKSFEEVRNLHIRREYAVTNIHRSLWWTQDGQELDAIICPLAPHPVPAIDQWDYGGYTLVWTGMDYPTGNVPVGLFDEKDAAMEFNPESKFLSLQDQYNKRLWNRKSRPTYKGSPLSIQVVVPRLQEKRLLNAMVTIDKALQSRQEVSRRSKL
ncbi:MAG: hypothetical protein M1831_000934 [Alyxoria varia]|nr:MAG: hypothetical protein M1831_000934 [Alyxoria varia]